MRPNQIFIVLCAFCFGALLAFWLYALENTTGRNQVQTEGKALIGAPFTLQDHNGENKSSNDFKGKYMLVYFGYSFCPDICPTDLQKMSTALELIGGKVKQIQPLFITIDPERDTAEQLKSYVVNFHPKLLGLTGSSEEIEKVKKAYKVYGVKVDENGKPAKTVKGKDYLMDHSPQTFLMGPDGSFIRYFRFSASAEDMALALNQKIK